MRQPLPLLAWAALAAGFIAASALQFHTRAERLARNRSIDEEHYDRVKVGMRLEEVEAVLGGPPGRFDTRRKTLLGTPRETGRPSGRGSREEWWSGDQGLIQVYFTEQRTVERTVFWRAGPAPSLSPGEKVRRCLRRVAEQGQDLVRRLRA
jgi:hypothetical protein